MKNWKLVNSLLFFWDTINSGGQFVCFFLWDGLRNKFCLKAHSLTWLVLLCRWIYSSQRNFCWSCDSCSSQKLGCVASTAGVHSRSVPSRKQPRKTSIRVYSLFSRAKKLHWWVCVYTLNHMGVASEFVSLSSRRWNDVRIFKAPVLWRVVLRQSYEHSTVVQGL